MKEGSEVRINDAKEKDKDSKDSLKRNSTVERPISSKPEKNRYTFTVSGKNPMLQILKLNRNQFHSQQTLRVH
jgi:hypothetical protein